MAEQASTSGSTENEQNMSGDGISTCTLSVDLLEKAKLELNEDPSTRAELIHELRGLIDNWKPSRSEEKSIVLSNKQDRFLLMFLRARKFDVEKALQLYINYHVFRCKHSNMLADLNFKSIEHVLNSELIKVLDAKGLDGSVVLYVCPRKWDSVNVPFLDNFRATFLVLDRLIENEETQINGFSVVYDFTGSSLMSMLKVAQSELITKGILIELLQEAFPARFKGVHLFHQPWYISMVLSVIRPFMKQKLRDRIHSHGSDFDSLHRYVEVQFLPTELGGSLDNHNSTFGLFENENGLN